MLTALEFLNFTKAGFVNPQLLKSLGNGLHDLQMKMNATDQIKKYLAEREKRLRSVFEKLGMIKKMRSFQKQVVYYHAQLNSFKSLIEDPQELKRKLLQLIMNYPAFTRFFADHSQLSSLFIMPGSSRYNVGANVLQGLQTRNVFNEQIVERFGSDMDVSLVLNQSIESVQQHLNRLEDKLATFSSDDSNDQEVIPGFKPNVQKTKTFIQRIEYGANIQSQKARFYFPVTTDIGLSLGYKLNNCSVIGIGASYTIGWGRGWNQIAITQQGIGIRSYMDWKIKASICISGGYEQNYRNAIHSLNQLQHRGSWQKSGLIGLSKIYQLNKKLKGDMKLLWDFLSYQQLPKASALVFRIGYSLK